VLVPAGAEEGLFKPTADGWIFSAPNPWTFARRRSYLVPCAQKAELAQRVRRSMYFRLLSFIPLIAVTATTLFLFPSLLRPTSVGAWLSLALLDALATVAINLSDYLAIRPSLAGLPRTTERISLSQMCGRQARSMLVARLATLTTTETLVLMVNLAGVAVLAARQPLQAHMCRLFRSLRCFLAPCSLPSSRAEPQPLSARATLWVPRQVSLSAGAVSRSIVRSSITDRAR